MPRFERYTEKVEVGRTPIEYEQVQTGTTPEVYGQGLVGYTPEEWDDDGNLIGGGEPVYEQVVLSGGEPIFTDVEVGGNEPIYEWQVKRRQYTQAEEDKADADAAAWALEMVAENARQRWKEAQREAMEAIAEGAADTDPRIASFRALPKPDGV